MMERTKLNERQYLSKNKKGNYTIIYPLKDENGKLIKSNLFFADFNQIMNFVLILCLLFTAWAYSHDTSECRELLENTGEYCEAFQQNQPPPINPYPLTLGVNGTELNIPLPS